MTDVLDPTADEVYEAVLEPRRRSRVTRVVAGALDLWCALIGGGLELTAAGDVVVRRRHDGGEELRIPVGGVEEAGTTLEHVREQLAEMTPAEFRAAWSVG